MSAPRPDIARTTLLVLFLGAMMAAALWVVRPFLGAAIWATMVVVATWPMMLRVQQRLWNRRWIAVLVMTLLLLLVFLVPLATAVVTIVGNADRISAWVHLATSYRFDDNAPAWLSGLPLVGAGIDAGWHQLTALGIQDLLPKVTPYAGDVTRWIVGQVGGVGFLLIQFLLTVLIAALLYASGEEAAQLVRRLALRLAGERGLAVVDLARGSIRGVALGVGGTALAQALLAGIGLAIGGVPVSGLLTALVFMFCIAQIGPLPVLVPAIVWLFWSGAFGHGVFLIVIATIVSTLDNVLRPMLIRIGADLPLLLIFVGVVGGLLGFGLVGIFVGPLVLAVAYTLLEAWMAEGEATPAMPPPHEAGAEADRPAA
ncbi:MAG: AI-2E family transporter YdiK [Burkholderiales bacterium]|nr:AI-2E family transporter YdiK [Burkholderiales bacterium]